MKTTSRISSMAATTAFLILSWSAQAQLTPATLGDPEAEKYLPKFIGFPETHGDALVRLDCYVLVKTNGKLDGGCYVKNNWDPDFAYAVFEATKKARMIPATDGKKAKEVVVQFQVIFEKKEERKTIKVVLNNGLPDNTEEYGEGHLAAQRMYGHEPWMKKCPKRAEWLVNARAHVNDEGVASSVDLEHVRGIVPTGPCLGAIIETIETAAFSPAMIDGVAVPSSYVEPFGN